MTYQKYLLLAENAILFNNPVCSFFQSNVKIHPHKPILINIIIYTSDSFLFLKKMFKGLIVMFIIL